MNARISREPGPRARYSVMKSVRSHRATYVAAFLLGALIALLFAAKARSATAIHQPEGLAFDPMLQL